MASAGKSWFIVASFLVLLVMIGCSSGGSSSNLLAPPVNNPAPIFNSVSPPVLAVGSPDTTVAISGTNFLSTSQVILGGSAVTAKFVSSTQLSAVVPAGDLASPTTIQLTVSNPSPGGGVSSPHSLTVVEVKSLVLVGTPSTVGQANGPWQLAVSAMGPNGHAVTNLPINLQTSVGELSAAQGLTDSNGAVTAILTPSNNPKGPAAISATTGAQTAVIQVVFSNGANAKSVKRARTAPLTPSQPVGSPISIGIGNVVGTPNAFMNNSILQSGCATNASLSTTETSTCQQFLGQSNIQLSAPSIINASCQLVSITSTVVSVAECGVTVATVLSCISGVGAVICAAGADFTVTAAAPACIEFLAQQIANQFGNNSVTAASFEAEGLVEDPTDPLNLASTFCTVAQSLFPSGPLIYVVNNGSNSMTVMDQQGNEITMPGGFPNLNAPDGLAFDPDTGLLYAGNTGNNTVTAYDPTTGNLVSTSGGFPPGPCTGYDVIYERFSHHLYVNDAFCNQMLVFDANGNPVSLPSGAFSTITNPFGMTWNPLNDQVLITDGTNNQIFVCDPSGASCAASTAFPNLSSPDDLVTTPDANIYVPNEGNGTVTEYGPSGNLINTISLTNLIAQPVPETVAFYALTNFSYQIFISDSSQDVIWVYDNNGHLINKLGGVSVLNGPKGMVVIP